MIQTEWNLQKTLVTPNSSEPPAKLASGKGAEVSAELLEKSRQSIDTVLLELENSSGRLEPVRRPILA